MVGVVLFVQDGNFEKNIDVTPETISANSHKKIWLKCGNGHSWETSPNKRIGLNRGCPYCSHNPRVLPGYNDLETLNPDLAKEWNYERNGDLLPSQITCGSEKKVWWKCNKGHEWDAIVQHRSKGKGCPICSGKRVLKGYNDLETVNSELAREWNYEKNGQLLSSQITCGSAKKVWWKCNKGHEWSATVQHRSKGKGCPVCAGKKVLKGYNDLESINPDLAKEWNYERNGNLLPSQVTSKSNKKVWWKCKEGHEWQALINSRNRGNGCPKCHCIGTSFSEQSIYFYLMLFLNKNNEILNRYKFKDSIGVFEIDIFIPSMALAIEHDGKYWHKNKKETDKDKTTRLANLGIRLIHVLEYEKNKIVDDNIFYNYRNLKNLSWAIKSVFNLLGCNFDDVDVVRDRLKILHPNKLKVYLIC